MPSVPRCQGIERTDHNPKDAPRFNAFSDNRCYAPPRGALVTSHVIAKAACAPFVRGRRDKGYAARLWRIVASASIAANISFTSFSNRGPASGLLRSSQ